jgi:hypothetical protein
MLGTAAARRLLEVMTDAQFRLWADRLITAVACCCMVRGTMLLAAPFAQPPASGP